MTDSAQSAEQRQYVAEFSGGPLDGTVEHRFLVDGRPEESITELAIVIGTEGMFGYRAGEHRQVGDTLHVRYSYDAQNSDELRGQADPESESKQL